MFVMEIMVALLVVLSMIYLEYFIATPILAMVLAFQFRGMEGVRRVLFGDLISGFRIIQRKPILGVAWVPFPIFVCIGYLLSSASVLASIFYVVNSGLL